MALFAITLYGRCCWYISIIRSESICSMCSESNNSNHSVTMPAYWCIWNVYFASNTKHSLPYNMAACTWWPWIQNLVTSLHLIYSSATQRRGHISVYSLISPLFTTQIHFGTFTTDRSSSQHNMLIILHKLHNERANLVQTQSLFHWHTQPHPVVNSAIINAKVLVIHTYITRVL